MTPEEEEAAAATVADALDYFNPPGTGEELVSSMRAEDAMRATPPAQSPAPMRRDRRDALADQVRANRDAETFSIRGDSALGRILRTPSEIARAGETVLPPEENESTLRRAGRYALNSLGELVTGGGAEIPGAPERATQPSRRMAFDPDESGDITIDPIAYLTSAVDSASMGNLAEIAGAPNTVLGVGPSEEELERAITALRERAPGQSERGAYAGTLPHVLLPSAGTVAEGAGAGRAGQLAANLAEGSGAGVAAHTGQPGEQGAVDTAISGLLGAGIAGVPAAISGAQGLRRRADAMRLRQAGGRMGDIQEIGRARGARSGTPEENIGRAADIVRENQMYTPERTAQAQEEALAEIRRALGVDAEVDPRELISRARQEIVSPLRAGVTPQSQRAADEVERVLSTLEERHVGRPTRAAQRLNARRQREFERARQEESSMRGMERRIEAMQSGAPGQSISSSELARRIPADDANAQAIAAQLRAESAPVVNQVRRGARGRMERVPEQQAERVSRDLEMNDLMELRARLEGLPSQGSQRARQAVEDAIEELVQRHEATMPPPVPPSVQAPAPVEPRIRPLGMGRMQSLKGELDDVIGRGWASRDPSIPVGAYQQLRGTVNSAMEGALEQATRDVDPQALSRYQRAKDVYGTADRVRQWQTREGAREAANRQVSPSDYLSGAGAAAMTGNPLAAAGAVLGNKALRATETGGLASAFEAISGAARRVGPQAQEALQRAASRGPTQVAATSFALQSQNPSYRMALQEEQDLDDEDRSPLSAELQELSDDELDQLENLSDEELEELFLQEDEL